MVDLSRRIDQSAGVLKNEVQEVQGWYGSFSLSERVIQKIWLKGDFDQSELRTESGKFVRVLDPGRWNLLEGPDFLEARLELDGEQLVADVEVHFYAGDWHLHGHGSNPRFAGVRLHVVLYPETKVARPVSTFDGTRPELLYLLPLLTRDLEEYAVEDALLELEQVEETEWMLRFLEHPLEKRRSILREGAEARWMRKVHYAEKRLQGASWREACHQFCLEVLGYARNRAPMNRLALRHPIENFAAESLDSEALFMEESNFWRLSGLRPANHPRHRIEQYAAICRAHPDWPERLEMVLKGIEEADGSLPSAAFRKQNSVSLFLNRISEEVFSNKISAKRLNTLIGDGLLPLGQAAGYADLNAFWMHWPAGDAPDCLYGFLKQAQMIDRSEPYSNGQIQGGLQLLIEQ